MSRSRIVLLAGALAICLVAGSTPRIVGDGGEYLAQALNFATLRGPGIWTPNVPSIQAEIGRFDPVLADWDIRSATYRGHGPGRDFVHFWFYALLATPALWVTQAIGAPPNFAFAVVNLALLLLALYVVLPRIGSAACVLIFAGPTIWWLDKIHTEIFSVALLTLAMALIDAAPWWSLVAAGAASTQNPPMAVLLPLVGIAAIAGNRRLVTDRRFLAGAAAALALALLQPVYTYSRYGQLSLLLSATNPGVPHLAEISSTVLDPDIGLIGNDPFFLLAVAVALLFMVRKQASALLSREMIVAALAAVVFLVAVAKTGNHHHGGTPSLTRYALWLLPLSVPLFAWGWRRGGLWWHRTLWTLAVTSALVSVFAFHPGVRQYGREPTWMANWLWTTHPGWQNPLPEIFAEVQLHDEFRQVPVTTSGCEKVLLGGSVKDSSAWPVSCYPAPVPEWCGLEAPCYANFNGHGYDFVRAPGTIADPYTFEPSRAWPLAAGPFIRRLYDNWNWPTLPFDADLSVVRQAVNVRVIAIGRDDRFILILRRARGTPALRLRPDSPMSGQLADPTSGEILRSLHVEPSTDPVSLDLPPGFDLLVLTLEADNGTAPPTASVNR
jgi:hypothetical protein